jgi:hypothetical protein
MDNIWRFYGIDWVSNVCFILFIWFIPKYPYPSQYLAMGGSLGTLIIALMIGSLANFLGSTLFLVLYLRAAYLMRKTYGKSKEEDNLAVGPAGQR